jgi:hypothetical protein
MTNTESMLCKTAVKGTNVLPASFNVMAGTTVLSISGSVNLTLIVG